MATTCTGAHHTGCACHEARHRDALIIEYDRGYAAAWTEVREALDRFETAGLKSRLEAAENALAAMTWVPVLERLPLAYTDCLIVVGGPNCSVLYPVRLGRVDDDGEWVDSDGSDVTVTHWMVPPAPPKE